MRYLLLCLSLCFLACNAERSVNDNDNSSNTNLGDIAERLPQQPPAERKAPRPLSDLIQIEQPLPNKDIQSPLIVKGKARGQWFFEGDFPVKLIDKDDKTIATGIASAQGKWMTTDFVPFELQLTFDQAPDDERGYLVFEKSNASGKPQHDRSYRLPVLFPPK